MLFEEVTGFLLDRNIFGKASMSNGQMEAVVVYKNTHAPYIYIHIYIYHIYTTNISFL